MIDAEDGGSVLPPIEPVDPDLWSRLVDEAVKGDLNVDPTITLGIDSENSSHDEVELDSLLGHTEDGPAHDAHASHDPMPYEPDSAGDSEDTAGEHHSLE